jgi:hypothetical protein
MDGYAHWDTMIRQSTQNVLISLLKERHIEHAERMSRTTRVDSNKPVQIRLKVAQARGLIGKDGNPRGSYCNITFGDFSNNKTKKELFRTEVAQNGSDPNWNQSMTITISSLADQVQIEVYDKYKDYFIGSVLVDMSLIVVDCAKSKISEKWYTINGRDKEKTVKGSVFLCFTLIQEKEEITIEKSFQELLKNIEASEIDKRSFFDVLMRACILYDVISVDERDDELLSRESSSLLRTWGEVWQIPVLSQIISYVSVAFELFKKEIVAISDFLKAIHTFYQQMKKKEELTKSQVIYI